MASGTIYSPIWAGYPDSNGSWSFQARTTYSTSETPTTFTVTIGATYLRQTREADVHGNGGWHAGAVLRSSAYRRISDKVKQPTVTTGYLGIVNNSNSTDLYFANATTYKQVGSGGSMTIAKTHSARTVYLNALGYRSTTKGNFNGLAEGINTGANSTAGTSVAISVPAMGKYTITYNTNGGNAVASTSQFLDSTVDIAPQSTTTTKDNYTFKGWATTNGGPIAYPVGETKTYTGKTNITLYAVWEYNFGLEKDPITAQRKAKDSTETDDDGTNATITGTYRIVGNGANVGTINGVYKRVSGTTDWGASLSCTINQGNNTKASGTTSHTVSFSISGLTGIDTDKSYDVKVVVNDQHGNTIEPQSYISQAYYTMDFQRGGREIAFGTPASDDLTNHPNGLFKCAMDAWFSRDIITVQHWNLDDIGATVGLYGNAQSNTDSPLTLGTSGKNLLSGKCSISTTVDSNKVFTANATNGTITVNKTGTYLVNTSAYMDEGFTVNDIVRTRLIKNGSSVGTLGEVIRRFAISNPYDYLSTTFVIWANQGDVFQLHGYNQTGARGRVIRYQATRLVMTKLT